MSTTQISNSALKTSKTGLELIKQFEGCKLQTYLCPAGIPTIGYGHTGPEVKIGMRITPQQAEELLLKDLEAVENNIKLMVTTTLTSNQFNALVCFIFNIGSYAFKKSTMIKYINCNDFKRASEEFMKWNKVNGQPVQGLTRRRTAEQVLFNKQ